MNKALLNVVATLLIVTNTIPTHAMFSRVSRTLGIFNSRAATTATVPRKISFAQQRNVPTLAMGLRSLAAQSAAVSSKNNHSRGSNYNQSENNNSSSNRQTWGQWFRSRLSAFKKADFVGASFFGWHLWYSNSDQCKNPEDFKDYKKVERMQAYFDNGDDYLKKQIGTDLSHACREHKDDKKTMQIITEFACKNFEALLTTNPDTLLSIMIYHPKAAKRFTPLACDNFIEITKHRSLFSEMLRQNPKATNLFIMLTLDNKRELEKTTSGKRWLAFMQKENAQTNILFTPLDRLSQSRLLEHDHDNPTLT